MKPKAVYVHVPFCEQICHYCDFNKFFLDRQPVSEYLDLCETEIVNTLRKFPTKGITSVYVGGGTPTSLSTAQLRQLLTAVKTHFPLEKQCEWTVEVNPGSADQDKLVMMKELGVNRLSIGVQTFDENLLKAIGRDHQVMDVMETISTCKEVGFQNISMDLMIGLPNQTTEQVKETLRETLNLKVQHISAYSLKVEEKTVFYQLWRKGKLPLPGEDVEADMYEILRNTLAGSGFSQYEISNFAIPGYESKHNLTYWDNDAYYGIGAGSHSYVDGVRRINHGPLPKYIASMKETGFPYREEHEVSKKEQMEEELFMGLRKRSGVSLSVFNQKYGLELFQVFPEAISDLQEKGLLVVEEGYIRLTERGVPLGNEVFERFLLGEESWN
ncbi:radical SAM family heme chaperone HemW [Evansella tamaricis]|uniref:Heme chaperone HemW n=1 Tax=Evansella tamaricis TaxID=2069301 RepID=A0ABS6JK37_9BACI|nr:radical SAM family heme chaperone HemW [Evansella tamaricis]MBU9713951.1 radical SAM family heme chaperone HemW [Evansella tamaricis]